MEFNKALIVASKEIFSGYGINPEFQGEIEETQLSSINQVNILIGLSGGIKGNLVMSFKKTYAFKLVSKMMGDLEVNAFSDFVKSALGKVANMVVVSAINKLEHSVDINLSPPTIVVGERIFLNISRVKSNKLTFKAGDDSFNIAFCIE